MAKKSFSTSGMDILGIENETVAEEQRGLDTPSEPKTIVSAVPQKQKNERLIQSGFYITERHKKALKLREALRGSTDKDQSAIVRAALDLYLAEELKRV